MKTRILAALLLGITLTAYNQTPRRAQQDNNKKKTERTNQNTKSEPKKEAVKSEQRTQTRTKNEEPKRTYKQAEQRDNNQRVDQNRGRDQRNEQHSTQGTRRSPENRVVVREQNHETRQKVVIRNNRPETRTYVRIERPVRNVVVVHHPKHYTPVPVSVRRTKYVYRAPVQTHIYWSISLRNDFRLFYPEIRVWHYDLGHRIPVVPAYDAEYYVGDVARIYGRVTDVYYEYRNDEYYLYFGDYFPYQDFSIVVPGVEARAFSRRPERFFEGSHVAATGYVSDFDEKPEMVIRRASQIEVY